MARNSTDYLFTVTELNDERIAEAKLNDLFMGIEDSIQEMNAKQKCLHVLYKRRYRVIIRGRLGKDNPNAHLYRVGGKYYRSSSQDIRHEHATRFDVYLREVRVWPKTGDHF